MAPHDWLDWTNSGIGVIGLLLTAGAIRQATGAKNAARGAREAVFRRNATDAMLEIVRIAEQLNLSVLYERNVEAMIHLRELIFRLPRDREEFRLILRSDVDRLKVVESRCKLWADFLGFGEFPLGAAIKKDLFDGTLNAVQELSAIQGRLRSVLGQEEI